MKDARIGFVHGNGDRAEVVSHQRGLPRGGEVIEQSCLPGFKVRVSALLAESEVPKAAYVHVGELLPCLNGRMATLVFSTRRSLND